MLRQDGRSDPRDQARIDIRELNVRLDLTGPTGKCLPRELRNALVDPRELGDRQKSAAKVTLLPRLLLDVGELLQPLQRGEWREAKDALVRSTGGGILVTGNADGPR